MDTEEVPTIDTPLVFQCLKCRSIVGDSLSVVSIHQGMQLITLSAAEHIRREKEIYTSKSGDDIGSTFYRFSCKICSSVIGRYYLTTSKDLDALREQFSFDIQAVSSYQLGKPSMNTNALPSDEKLPSEALDNSHEHDLRIEITKVRGQYLQQ